MSTVPSGVLPLTASGPSARLPPVPAVHPARCSTKALRSAARTVIDLIAPTFIPLPPVCPGAGAGRRRGVLARDECTATAGFAEPPRDRRTRGRPRARPRRNPAVGGAARYTAVPLE